MIGKFSEALGYNIEEVDAWGEAAVRNGGSAEAFRSSIQGLDSSLTEMKLTGGGGVAETFAQLGISAQDAEGKMKGAFDLLPEIASSFEGLSKQESANLGAKLGLDQGTILMLQQGRVAVDDLVEKQRQLGGRTKEGYKASAEFNDALADTSRMFTGITDSGNPGISAVLNKNVRWLAVDCGMGKRTQDVCGSIFYSRSWSCNCILFASNDSGCHSHHCGNLAFYFDWRCDCCSWYYFCCLV